MIPEILEAQIEIGCKELRMPGLRRHFRNLIREAEEQQMGYASFLRAILNQEIQERHQKRRNLLLRQAKFPSPKTLADFDFAKAPGLPKMKILKLAESMFVKKRDNVICIGKAGTGNTSNLEFSRWVETFDDPALTSALLDRLTHHAHIIVFDGESYRFRESLASKDQEVIQ